MLRMLQWTWGALAPVRRFLGCVAMEAWDSGSSTTRQRPRPRTPPRSGRGRKTRPAPVRSRRLPADTAPAVQTYPPHFYRRPANADQAKLLRRYAGETATVAGMSMAQASEAIVAAGGPPLKAQPATTPQLPLAVRDQVAADLAGAARSRQARQSGDRYADEHAGGGVAALVDAADNLRAELATTTDPDRIKSLTRQIKEAEDRKVRTRHALSAELHEVTDKLHQARRGSQEYRRLLARADQIEAQRAVLSAHHVRSRHR